MRSKSELEENRARWMANDREVLALRERSLALRNARGLVVVEPISDDIDNVPGNAENLKNRTS